MGAGPLRIEHSRYPRSQEYDGRWVLDNLMGPNVLWLAEALSQAMALRPGMRLLDLGCGKAVSSIFFAREFGLQVYATDLWIGASENWARVRQAGVETQVTPIHAEAHALPFAYEFFDAIVSLDAYHYFGTDDLYLATLARFLKPGGQLGIVVPGLAGEFDRLPPRLAPYWEPAYWTFHSPAWWGRHFERSGAVIVDSADMLPEGWKDWLRWLDLCREHDARVNPEELTMLRADGGQHLGFVRVVAHCPE